MGKNSSLIAQILLGRSDNSIAFRDLIHLLLSLGFSERINGSHHIFTRQGFPERITLQADGKHAKGYQVRQIRQILLKYPELNNE